MKTFELIACSFALAWLLLSVNGCKSYNIKPDITATERFKIARQMFDNKDYFEAKNQFKILTLNNPGAAFVDEAQFYLGECHFRMKEYVLAADEFARLTRLYPKSKWTDDAEFNIAMCNYKLSPKPALDQTYTVKAVESIQRFIEDYPNSDRIPDAEKLLKACRKKLAEKDYKAGELYRKLGDYYGAYVYFGSVIGSYYDTPYFEPAFFWRAESLYKLRRFAEARHAFEELLRKFPESEFVAKAKARLARIESEALQATQSDQTSPNKLLNN